MAGTTGEQDFYVSGVFAMSFVNLNDTIGDYVGRANKTLKVNAAEDGVTVTEGSLDDHSARHENGGADEISVAGLSGALADEQSPVNHASEHEAGASDELGPIGNNTNGVIRLTNPGGAADIWDTSSETGAIQIALPAVASDMIYFHATVFEYADQAAFDIIVFGYLDTGTPQWLRATAVIIGDNPNTKRVRFCRNSDSSVWYVVIGNTDTAWAYPWIAISEFKAGHGPTIADWNSGWSMSLITSIPSYTDFDFTDARVSPEDHAARHQDGGADELDVTGLSGDLADAQDPKLHAASHKDAGGDELDAAELAGALGIDGQVLKTDGAACSWGSVSIGSGELKTSSGEVSTVVPVDEARNVILPGGEYGFYPQTKGSATDCRIVFTWGGEDNYATYIGFENGHIYDVTFYAKQRYVTASGEVYWIFVLRDKTPENGGKIISTYQASDHPCFGNGGDPNLVEHPFRNFDPAKHEIIVINPAISLIKEIHDKTPKNRDLMETLFKQYGIDETVRAPWPEKQVTVDLQYNDFPFYAPGQARVIKKRIPKPGYIKTAGLRKK